MIKENGYLLGGILVLLLVLLLFAVKKFHLLDSRPDQKITYRISGDQALSLHAFNAKNTAGDSPVPTVLFFHGGGWLYGGPEAFYPQCQYLSEQGYQCFSAQFHVNADLQPDIRGTMEDARAAYEYLLDHAGELNIDPARLFVGGGSSGGHLAAALGVGLTGSPGDVTTNSRSRPTGLILYNPVLDFSPGTLNHPLAANYWQDISPIHHVDAAVPPALILVGSHDPEVPAAMVEAFCEAVQSADGQCEVAIYQGQGHGFFNQPDYLTKTNDRVLKFLSTH